MISQKKDRLGMVARAFAPNTQEAETGRSLCLVGHSSLCSKFRASQGYRMRLKEARSGEGGKEKQGQDAGNGGLVGGA